MTTTDQTKSFIDKFIIESKQSQSDDQKILEFGVKDTIDVKGYQSKACCRAFESVDVAKEHAEIVERLLNAGCRVVGKTNMHEMAYGLTGINEYTGTPDNLKYPGIVPGGSSSGSATAVAHSMCDFALGTDTGGSVRIPAACTGVFGLKPTHGAVSRIGVHPPHSSLDCVGFFARDIDTIINVLERLNPQDLDAKQLLITKLPKFGVLTGLANVQEDIDNLIKSKLTSLVAAKQANGEGGEIVPITLQDNTHDQVFQAGVNIIAFENYSAYANILDRVSPDVASRLGHGKNVTSNILADSEKTRTQFTEQIDQLLQSTPIIALPTLPVLPPTVEEVSNGSFQVMQLSRLVRPFNVTGHPAISIPFGEISNRPVALQLITSKGNELYLCKVVQLLLNP
ncbi:hypothetical protein DFA_06083 [Cavenderia fasciculata]|uniref:Amidase domain-containing protein n=1 Tax=Cavenderia fasciculata TaxID=261658 RepID=F4PK21_CACFS|nr:uncharacterized protein DFA_06083 [Cavenderia fasciculata]EGG23945.1 hypothetical protein DFA_06083 [Cavenderia fasciculata]|eukprot:XP_004361796.1 hypothetical protein DFA_06083 [Cavenderia fasciculata]